MFRVFHITSIMFISSIFIHILLLVTMYNHREHGPLLCDASSISETQSDIEVTYLSDEQQSQNHLKKQNPSSQNNFRIKKTEGVMPLYTDRWKANNPTLSQTSDENKVKRKRLESAQKDNGDNNKQDAKDPNSKNNKKNTPHDQPKEKTPNPFETLDKKEWGDLQKRLQKESSLRDSAPDQFEKSQHFRYLDVPDSYVHRERRYEDIATKDVFPTLLNLDKPFEELMTKAPDTLKKYYKRNEIIENYRLWEQGKEWNTYRKIYLNTKQEQDKKEPLHLSDSQQNMYFDETLLLTKEEQLNNFFEKYINYDPNTGDLPIAMRRLYYKNIQRIAYSFNTDPTYIILDYYQENLNKEDFLRNTMYQANELRNTKTMTEILFAIENIYEIQYRGLSYYFVFRNLLPTLTEESKKFKRIQALSAVEERYQKLLEEKNIRNHQDLSHLYYRKRIEIVEFMEKNTPENYRASDITFLKGMIYWQRGIDLKDKVSQLKAVQIWNTLNNASSSHNNGDFLHKDVLTILKPVLDGFSVVRSDYFARVQRIRKILENKIRTDIEKKIDRERRLIWN